MINISHIYKIYDKYDNKDENVLIHIVHGGLYEQNSETASLSDLYYFLECHPNIDINYAIHGSIYTALYFALRRTTKLNEKMDVINLLIKYGGKIE